MEDKIFEVGPANFGEDSMHKLAKDLGMNVNKFKADMNGQCKQQIRKEQSEMARVGARGTPAFFINGRFLSGNRPIDHFKRLIDEELKKANDRINKGEAKVETYYDEYVLKRGKKSV